MIGFVDVGVKDLEVLEPVRQSKLPRHLATRSIELRADDAAVLVVEDS